MDWDVPGTLDRDVPGRSNRIFRVRPGDVGRDVLGTSWGPIFAGWVSYYSSKSIFLRQTVLDRNMINIHRILEKTAECEPYDFAKVNTIALI